MLEVLILKNRPDFSLNFMRLSLRSKTMLGVAVIEAVLLAALVTVAVGFMRDSANEALLKRANTTARLFATTTKDAVLSYDLASLDTYTSDLMLNPDIVYVKVLSAGGTVFSSAGDKNFINKKFLPDNAVETVTDGVFDVLSEIKQDETVYGEVQLGIAIDSITAAMSKVRNWTISIAVMEMFLVAIFSYILGVYLTKNIYRLRKVTGLLSENIKNGVYESTNVTIKSQDELQDLSIAFNELAETLLREHSRRTEFEGELIRLNETLEGRVELRTEQLQAQNSELEQINKDLALAQEQLVQSEKMASVGQLAAGVAHEINNPLGYVTSNLKVLTEYIEEYQQACFKVKAFVDSDSIEQRKVLVSDLIEHFKKADFQFVDADSTDLILGSISGLERIAEIVKNLKQFSRADEDEFQECDINECVRTSLNMVNSEIKYHCDVKVDLQPLPIISANIGKIIQVLTNLLINGSQAVKQGGQLDIATSCCDNNVQVKVSDNGEGIPKGVIKKIFDPFFTTKPVGEGTGLGLSISYDIVQEHNGRIDVRSVENEGTTFTITLPIQLQMEAKTQSES